MPVVPLALRMVPTYTGPGGATAANVLHFGDVGGDFDQTTCDDLLTAWISFWRQLTNEEWSINGTAECSDLTEDPPDVLIASSTGANGDGTGDALPAQVAFCLSLRTSGGRRGRGRIYIPGIGEGDVADTSRVSAGFVSIAISEFSDYASGVGSLLGWAPAVYSRLDGVVRVVQSVGADEVIDTQRRRVERLA